jgi:hydroxymethylpyrimidine/phosphomethylpyrimidine kinase
VVDPVMISKHGAPLMDPEARDTLARRLLPRAFLVTPNLHEAAALAGFAVADPDSMERAARAIAALGPAAVLVKGGHLVGAAVDVLYYQGEVRQFTAARVESRGTHGTGCTYSAAVAAGLAKGCGLGEAVEIAKTFITRAIESSPGLGKGCGPVNHHARVYWD